MIQLAGPPAPTGRYIAVGVATEGNLAAHSGWNPVKVGNFYYTANGSTNFDPSCITGFDENGWAVTMSHELGHYYGLGDCDATSCQGVTTMSRPASTMGPQACDTLYGAYYAASPPTSGGSGSGGSTGPETCSGPPPISCPGFIVECSPTYGWYCSNQCLPPEPQPCCQECYVACENGVWTCVGSPVVLDVFGTGFHFTDIKHGVRFRVLPSQNLHEMSWPDAAFRNGWLALDRNGDGKITDFTELFGNATPQPKSDHPNGYLALAVFDAPENGGNGNGFIDPGDAIYSQLRIWIDDNHNGISEPEELHTLQEAGIFKIDLTYFYSRYVDENGNEFRYKSRVWDQAGYQHDMCYDVFVKIAY